MFRIIRCDRSRGSPVPRSAHRDHLVHDPGALSRAVSSATDRTRIVCVLLSHHAVQTNCDFLPKARLNRFCPVKHFHRDRFADPVCGVYHGIYNSNNNNCCADTCLKDGEPRCRWDNGACKARVGGLTGCCPGNIAKNAPVCDEYGDKAPCNIQDGERSRTT